MCHLVSWAGATQAQRRRRPVFFGMVRHMAKVAEKLNGRLQWIPLIVVIVVVCIGYGKLGGDVDRNTRDISDHIKTLNRVDRIVSQIAGKLGVEIEEPD